MHRALLTVSFASVVAISGAAFAGGTVGANNPSSMTSSSASSASFAQDSAYSAAFGMAPGEENVATSGSMRDANGNLVVQNGMINGGAWGATTLNNQSGSGVGRTNGQGATAIGNQLNVVTMGSNNIVIVDSTQINNGDQTATNNGN